MSDKLQVKGAVIVSDSNIDDWFEFETKVLKAVRSNPYHSVNAIAVFSQYVAENILASFKLDGKLCIWTQFAIQVIEVRDRYPSWTMACTVTLKASKKGEEAEKAFENDFSLFSTHKIQTPFDVYDDHRELLGKIYQAGKHSEDEESEDESELNNEEFLKSARIEEVQNG